MSSKKSYRTLVQKLLLIFFVLLLLAVEISYRIWGGEGWSEETLYLSATRFIGAAVCMVFIFEFSFEKIISPLGNKKLLALAAVVPAFVVAINNFPFVSYFSGRCYLGAGAGDILMYGLFCLSVGLFEEMAFRGCVLMYLLKKRTESKKQIFMAILWSSVVFGLVHLVNLFTSSPIAVLLQIGYSALIGGLCSLVLLATKNIWLCVLLHSLYNFVGNVIPELGGGEMWTQEQMIFTAVVAVIVTAYCVWLFFKLPVQRAKELYE